LHSRDIDEMHCFGLVDNTGHRFDDTKGIRRRKISHHSAMASIVHIGQIDKAVKSPPRKRSQPLLVEPHKVCGYMMFYTVSQKKQDTKLLAITSPTIIRFSKFFH